MGSAILTGGERDLKLELNPTAEEGDMIVGGERKGAGGVWVESGASKKAVLSSRLSEESKLWRASVSISCAVRER